MRDESTKVREIIAKILGFDLIDITLESNLTDDLDADSLDLTDLVMTMEDEFDTIISIPDAERILTVKDAVDYINENVKEIIT